MKHILITSQIVLLLSCSSIDVRKTEQERVSQLKRDLGSIDNSNGIALKEADIIVQNYQEACVRVSEFHVSVQNKKNGKWLISGGSWLSPPEVLGSIDIETGEVRVKNFPTISHYSQIWKECT